MIRSVVLPMFLGLMGALPLLAQDGTKATLRMSGPLRPGGKVRLLLEVEPKDGSHVYYKNPGEMGLPVSLKWKDLPEGIVAGDLEFPVPHRVKTGELATFGYEGKTRFYLDLSASENADIPSGPLAATASWLSCNDNQCVPGKESFELDLANPETFDASRADSHQPVDASEGWSATVTREGDHWVVKIKPEDGMKWPDRGELDVFCEEQNFDNPAAKPELSIDGDGILTAKMEVSEYAGKFETGRKIPLLLAGIHPAIRLGAIISENAGN